VPLGQIGVAVKRFSSVNTPPKYIVITAPNGSYCQAAGSRGRFIAEFRETFGEGFKHYRAACLDSEDDTPTTVYYRYQCSAGKHPRLGCPLLAMASDVLSLNDAQSILLRFAHRGDRHPNYRWRDVTEKFLIGRESYSLDDEILEIRPGPPTKDA
jgi:hypothetical protein